MVRNKREFSSQLNIHFPFNMKYICRDWSVRSSNTDIQLWTADSSASTDQAGVSNGGGLETRVSGVLRGRKVVRPWHLNDAAHCNICSWNKRFLNNPIMKIGCKFVNYPCSFFQHLWKNHPSPGTCQRCSSTLCCKSANETDGDAASRLWLCVNFNQKAGTAARNTFIFRTWGKLLIFTNK